MFFEGEKENDMQAGVKSNNMYPTFWPRDSKVVREEQPSTWRLWEKPCPRGEPGFDHSREVKKTPRPEAEENEIFLMTDYGFQKAQGKVSVGRGEDRIRKDDVQSCMGIRVQ